MSTYAPIEVGAEAYIVRGGKLLLGLRGPDCYMPNTWGLPGGRLEFLEKAQDAVIREIREELGITVSANAVQFLVLTEDPQPQYNQHHLHLTYQVDIGDAQPKIMEPQSCLEWRWFDPSQLPENVFEPHGLILEKLTRGQFE